MSNKYERLSFDSIDSTDSIDKLASDDVEGTNHTNNNSTLLPPSSSGHTRSISNLSEFDLDDEDYEPTAGLLPEEQNRGALSSFGANEALMAIATESGKSDMKMAFMNMANSIIGAGIIGQPYAVRQSGLIGGIILLLVLTVVIDWTIRLMVVNAKISGTDTFQATVSKCYGKVGLITISVAQGAFAFGGSMAFCVIIGDTIPHVINALFPSFKDIPVISFLIKRNSIIVIFTTFISYPLALNRDISKLAKASALALVSMVVIVLTVVIRGPSLNADFKGSFSLPLLTINSGIFQGISVISFAFVCHHNSLLIYDSLKKPTMDRFKTVTHWSTGVSMVACVLMGVGGFVVFRDKTKGNVLNNFPPNDIMANVARFCFGFNMLTTLPLEIFVCREVLLNYFYPDAEFSRKRHIITTTVLVFTAMSVSLFTCNLGAILELVGASSACVMAYILPPMCFLKLSGKGLREKIPSYSCIAFGVLVMTLSTVQTIIKLMTETEEDHCTA
ncbi:similar to Saccharomyces cerevisiae YEL064C AVT2 Putative transporter [Geotrichum candidum]|uniref:Similar to Saccharomyces cerevisiae YEL064C AVT2 Putative transporter n=1 Tax=Geotrichum candidum TaxID=1173061 RepID=A0A0J9XJ00_GEOCN|nr:similar to Saccharomyces cerevisiae YEL064C AVT2 Putative transporter [Geotrichum candidum]